MPKGVYERTEKHRRTASMFHNAEWREKVSRAKTGKHYPKISEAKRGVFWGGNEVRKDTGNKRAQKLYPNPKPCEVCGGEKDIVRHHINHDTLDNRVENIRWICRSCHIKVEHPENGIKTWFKKK